MRSSGDDDLVDRGEARGGGKGDLDSRDATEGGRYPLYSHARSSSCPSVYEPFGIINLEAMACETPVIAPRLAAIPEIVVPGETRNPRAVRGRGRGLG